MNTNSVSIDLREVARLFDLGADFVSGAPYGSGHINDTYCVTFDQAGTRLRYTVARHNLWKRGWSVSLQSVVRASRPDLRSARRDASATLWRETRQPLFGPSFSTNPHARQYISSSASNTPGTTWTAVAISSPWWLRSRASFRKWKSWWPSTIGSRIWQFSVINS